ncbi:callose synthase 3 [Mangifera indica]|uniref:callose synthase 3 n=1 Tax=Mangifera indica TaxID=29780 RepID=UPI001CFA2D93|nr:callose synthase 3 [Mangifera indica]XP_044505148.1 callose synthase 3 [Mangifera indica]XP_044505149.1 callose synthase 3 [Mangifera indica]
MKWRHRLRLLILCLFSVWLMKLNRVAQELLFSAAFMPLRAHRLDPTSSGQGVHQFKTALLQRLESENDPTLQGRREKTDVRELQRFYQQYYNKYIQPLQYAADKADRAKLTKAYKTAEVLFQILKVVNPSVCGVDPEVM